MESLSSEEMSIQLSMDISDLSAGSQSVELSHRLIAQYKKYCFKKNPYIFQFETNRMLAEAGELVLLRTHKSNYAAVNQPVLLLLEYLNGRVNLESLFNKLPGGELHFQVCDVIDDKRSEFFTLKREVFCVNINNHNQDSFKDFILLIKKLYNSHLVTAVDIGPGQVSPGIRLDSEEIKFAKNPTPGILSKQTGAIHGNSKVKSPVLLLGDTVGPASVGLLYLASYLRRHHIEAYCQWNNASDTRDLLKENIRKLMEKIQPQLVGVSMKWFPHLQRVFEICKLVKEYNPDVTVVVGGDSASYYYPHIIRNQWIDYVVLGDGEKPILEICRQQEHLTNCVYKEKTGGKIIETPLTYVQDEGNSAEIFLSHLDELLVSPKDIYSTANFFINTGKGCSARCFYCTAGSKNVQKQAFNRTKPLIRGIEQVRRDIKEAGKYTSGLMFDFDLPFYDSLDYYRRIWEGIDLSNHFCEFYSWMIPSPEFIRLAAAAFKYIYLSIDMCSLSEPHRRKLASLGLVKPQPLDQEIVSFFHRCEEYDNVEIQITPILGLPYFSPGDINRGKALISRLIDNFSPFSISWGRLHAQPGTLLSKHAEEYGMHSYAKEYEDFLYYSKLNMEGEKYPNLDTLNYPYIYFNDDTLNRQTSRYFVEINKMINQHREKFGKRLIVTREITPGEMANNSGQLVRLLREKGVPPETIKDSQGRIDAVKVFKTASEFYHDCPRVCQILEPIINSENKRENKQPLLAEGTQLDGEDFEF